MIGAARRSVQTTIAAFILCCATVPGTAAEQAVSNKDVAKYLTEARSLAGGKRWDAAWAALEKAERVPDASPYTRYKIDEFKGYVLTQQHKDAEAAHCSSSSRNPQRLRLSSATTISRQLRSCTCAPSSTRNRRVRRKQRSRANRTIQRSSSLPASPDTSPGTFAVQPPGSLSSWQLPSAKEDIRRKRRCNSS